MVHNNATCIWNDFLEDTSNVSTPTSHNSFSSSTRGCKYTSISFPGEVSPGINNDSMKKRLFHAHPWREIVWDQKDSPFTMSITHISIQVESIGC